MVLNVPKGMVPRATTPPIWQITQAIAALRPSCSRSKQLGMATSPKAAIVYRREAPGGRAAQVCRIGERMAGEGVVRGGLTIMRSVFPSGHLAALSLWRMSKHPAFCTAFATKPLPTVAQYITPA
jgi:hypothetical protein